MKITETFFDKCLVIEPNIRDDSRGVMEVFFCPEQMRELNIDFELSEQRLYKMRDKAFFGIHRGPAKLISLIQGKGIDYTIDLREGSDTYLEYKAVELSGDKLQIVYVPAGFGHAFLSLSEDTIQAYAIDKRHMGDNTRPINYKTPEIGLKLPVADVILSDYDRDAEEKWS